MKEITWRQAMRIARDILPDIPKTKEGRDFLGYVLWNHTGWPCFWNTDNPTKEIRKSILEYSKGKDGP